MVAAAPSPVVIKHLALDSRTPPIAIKLAHPSTSALPPSTLQYPRRYCNKKLSGGQRRFFLCPATKLLLPQTPCLTDASPTINSENPHTIAAREHFRTKPRRSPRRHRESQRLDRRDRKAAAADRAATRIYRVGTALYQPTPAGYLVALPDPISATKN